MDKKTIEHTKSELKIFWSTVRDEPVDLTGDAIKKHLYTLKQRSNHAFNAFVAAHRTTRARVALNPTNDVETTIWDFMYRIGEDLCVLCLDQQVLFEKAWRGKAATVRDARISDLAQASG